MNTSDTTPVEPSADAGLSGDIVNKYEEGRAKILSGAVKALATVALV